MDGHSPHPSWPATGLVSARLRPTIVLPVSRDDRDVLERVVSAMPCKSARELRVILRALDDAITNHPSLVHTHVFRGSWWTGDI
jgi:hypothetical protein